MMEYYSSNLLFCRKYSRQLSPVTFLNSRLIYAGSATPTLNAASLSDIPWIVIIFAASVTRRRLMYSTTLIPFTR